MVVGENRHLFEITHMYHDGTRDIAPHAFNGTK